MGTVIEKKKLGDHSHFIYRTQQLGDKERDLLIFCWLLNFMLVLKLGETHSLDRRFPSRWAIEKLVRCLREQ